MVLQYKCPSCGADMVFDSTSGMLTCQSCGRKEDVEAYAEEHENFQYQESEHTFREGEVNEYHCNNCGAVIVCDVDTTATTCSFCGAAVVLNDRLTGSLAPSIIIPFSVSKEQAGNAFKTWCKNGLITPSSFMTADRIKNITGLYVPFWLYDLNGIGEAKATCTKVRSYTRGEFTYTDTSYFDVYRKVDLNFFLVPADASSKMDDMLMDKLEPYDYKNLKEFSTPYLAGFIAEKYNYTYEDLFDRVKKRVEKYVDAYISSTIYGYATTTYNYKQINIRPRRVQYALLPVWMVCYNFRQKDYMFAMNGQTGKIVGKPPLSIPKILAWLFGSSAGLFLILRIITSLLGGGY